jgi:hypothetical protein
MAEAKEAAAFRSSNVETYKAAAARIGLRLSNWLREAADAALKAQGFSTGSPEQQYALVSGGRVISVPSFRPCALDQTANTPANAVWLPIENRDSEPFHPTKHWREKPLPMRVEGKVIVREYPVILKTLEAKPANSVAAAPCPPQY